MANIALAARAGTGALRAPPRLVVLVGVAVAGFAAAGFSVVSALMSDHVREPGVQAALVVWIILSYVLAGLVAWWRRPQSRLGTLMIAAGFGTFISMLGWSNVDLLRTIGQTLDFLPPILFLHVFLAFPSGRLERLVERVVVATAYLTGIGLGVGRMLLGGLGPNSLFNLTTEPSMADVLLRVQLLTSAALAVAGIGVLVARRRGSGRPLRRSLALLIDSFAVGLAMIAVLAIRHALGISGFETIQRITFFVVGLAPLAFLIGLLHARLARSAVGDLFVELRADPAPGDLRDALAHALRDPSLTLAYWLPEFESYADLDGRPVQLPGKSCARATTLIEDRDGARVAALIHDPALGEEPELLEGVTAAAAIALENARLHAELRARLEELRGSRARVIAAGHKERQRLERNLHDGAQQRLIALSLQLSMLDEQLDDPGASRGLGQAQREIATSLEELREIARGIHPAIVSGHGLEVALEQLAAHAPVPVRLTVEIDGRLPEPIEMAAYYLVSESLANVGKYALASSATVEISRHNGQVVIEVVDDGIGGADTELGSGLRGLADRVEALDGRLRVWSPNGGGTRVRAEIPCAP
jgi:signal transduction histidine kinase